MRLTLGRRLVNLLPVAQQTNVLHKWCRRQDMGRWSWVRISLPPWKRFSKKSAFPDVKNLMNRSPWVPRDFIKNWKTSAEIIKEHRSRHVQPHTKTKNPAVRRGGECYETLGRRLVNLLLVAQRTNAFKVNQSSTQSLITYVPGILYSRCICLSRSLWRQSFCR